MSTALLYESSLLFSVASSVVPFLADVLVLLGVLVMTLGVYGMVRLPDASSPWTC